MRNILNKCNLERQILEKIKKDNGASCHFSYSHTWDYKKEANIVSLTLLTSKNDEIFIAHTTDIYSGEIECLNELDDYLNDIKKEDSEYLTYEVVWSRSSSEKNKSFFYGKSLNEVIEKFYKGKEKTQKDYIIYNITLMPIS